MEFQVKQSMKNAKLLSLPAIAALALSGCFEERSGDPAPVLPNAVKYAEPLEMDAEIWSRRSARIEPAETVEIRARAGGYLDGILFKKGDHVKRGETLFAIDDEPYKIALDAAVAGVKAAEAKLELSEKNFQRAKGLLAQNAVSEEAYQGREAELLLSRAKLLEARAAERNAALNMKYTRVVSPIGGKISESFVDVGNLVSPNASVLARVVRDDAVKVYFELDGKEAVKYQKLGLLEAIDSGAGPEIEIVQKGSERKVKGRITYRDNMLSQRTSTLSLCADIDNPDGSLIPGAFADVRIKEGIEKGALFVPEEAVGTDLSGRYVLLIGEGDIIRQKAVRVGEKHGNLRRIISGISKGDRIVVSGIQRALPGRRVAPERTEIK